MCVAPARVHKPRHGRQRTQVCDELGRTIMASFNCGAQRRDT